MKGKFFIDDYFSKSWKFLYPLLGIETKPMGTYLYWEEINDCIDEYKLLVEYSKSIEVEHSSLSCIYETEDSNVYVFNLENFRADIDHFMQGSYSKFSGKAKEKVLKHWKWIKDGRQMYSSEAKLTDGDPHYHVFFYPSIFRELVAKEWHENFKYFGTYKEALDMVDNVQELCSRFDLDKETLKKKLV